MPDRFNYIAFFDLDLTITGEVSGNVLARTAYKKGLMSHSGLLRALWLLSAYKLGIRDPLRIINEMTGWVKGVKVESMNSISAEISEKILLPSVFQGALSEIRFHSAQNAKTVILSSSPSSICRVMADYLGMDDFVCSELESVDGILTGRPSKPLCFGEEKAFRMKEYCEKNNTTPGEAWFYGDSIADYPALCLAGTPVCVNPDKKLLIKANGNRWKIYNWECC